jgi:hypothetical protein
MKTLTTPSGFGKAVRLVTKGVVVTTQGICYARTCMEELE